jgi:hypothetical protein
MLPSAGHLVAASVEPPDRVVGQSLLGGRYRDPHHPVRPLGEHAVQHRLGLALGPQYDRRPRPQPGRWQVAAVGALRERHDEPAAEAGVAVADDQVGDPLAGPFRLGGAELRRPLGRLGPFGPGFQLQQPPEAGEVIVFVVAHRASRKQLNRRDAKGAKAEPKGRPIHYFSSPPALASWRFNSSPGDRDRHLHPGALVDRAGGAA